MWAFSSCEEQGLLSSCGAQALGARASVVVTCRFEGAPASVVVAQGHGLSCSEACGIFLDQGCNL